MALWTQNRRIPPHGVDDIAMLRARMAAPFDRFGETPPDVTATPGQLGPIAGEWIRPAQAVPGRVILYFHGGGFVTGSPQTHRPLIARLAEAGVRAAAGSGSGTLDLAGMPPAIAAIVRTAYADATGRIFLIAAGVALLTLVMVALMPASELRTTIRKVEVEPAELEGVAA